MKPDSDEIKLFLDNLAKESWLGPVRSHWVKYIFHFTDIRNAVAILKKEDRQMEDDKNLILVIGGTGKTGRRVAERLEAGGVPIRIGTPSTDPPFDWLDQSTWAPAVQGVKAA